MTAPVWTGVVPMTPERYTMLAGLASPWLEEYRDAPVRIGDDSGYEERAVYIAVTSGGVACYCGRTRPTRALRGGATAVRVGQHVTGTASKREEWAAYWVLPLRPETPDAEVDRLESAVAARLGAPLRHRRNQRRG